MKTKKSSIMVTILIVPWFNFAIGIKWPLVGILINGCRLVELLWALFCSVKSKRVLHNFLGNGYILPLASLYGVLFISTSVNSGNIVNALQLALYGFWPFVVLSIPVNRDKIKDTFLEGIVIAFSVLVVINLLLMLTYPEGIYTTYTSGTVTKYYLFGAKNQMVAPLMTALVFFVEYSFRRYNGMKPTTAFMCILCIAEIVMGGSGTGVLMVALFVALSFYQKWKAKSMNSTITLFIVLAVTVGFVVLRMQNWFDFVIVSILHKSLTLSDRIYVWDAAIEIIKAHPWIGTGISGSLTGDVLLNLSYLSKNTFAHNMFLDYLVMGGVGALGGFLMNLYVTKKQYDRSLAVFEHGKTYVWGGNSLPYCVYR